MAEAVETLVLDLLEWLLHTPRSYEQTMDAWRTSCPRLPVWEDANDLGLVSIQHQDGRSMVGVTPAGIEYLRRSRPAEARS